MLTPEIHRADPAARKRAIRWTLVATAVGLPVVWFIDRNKGAMGAWIADNVELVQSNGWLIALAAFLLMAPLIIFAVSIWQLGRQVVVTGCLPPPGRRTVRDMKVMKGPRAVGRGKLLQVMGAMLAAACFVVPLFLWMIIDELLR